MGKKEPNEKCEWCGEEKDNIDSIVSGDRVCEECLEDDEDESETNDDTEEQHSEEV